MGVLQLSRSVVMPGCHDCGRQKLEHYFTCTADGYTLCRSCFEDQTQHRRRWADQTHDKWSRPACDHVP